MKKDNEQLSALIDNEIINDELLDELMANESQQDLFSRYHFIGDVMRSEVTEQSCTIDVSQQVMAEINKQSQTVQLIPLESASKKIEKKKQNNIISFAKRFGQYAIAASVAGVVVSTSVITSQLTAKNSSNGLEVLNTVPFGGAAAPVSLQAPQKLSVQEKKEQDERLEALLKDHQLQLQTQP